MKVEMMVHGGPNKRLQWIVALRRFSMLVVGFGFFCFFGLNPKGQTTEPYRYEALTIHK
jgi:hypothetical protein